MRDIFLGKSRYAVSSSPSFNLDNKNQVLAMKFSNFPRRRLVGSMALLFSLTTASYAQAPGGQMPPPMVDVVTVKPETVTRTENLPARLEASREAVIIPRVSGIVEKRLFEEGSKVEAGEVLYQLDKASYKAQANIAKAGLNSANAALGQAQATRNLHRTTVNRYAPLVKSAAVSKQTYDEAVANLKVQESNIVAAQAGINSAKASIDAAEINLGYTDITAPISGIIGISEVTEGAYAIASQTKMATIRQVDPMFVTITRPASAMREVRKLIASGTAQENSSNEVEIFYEDGTPYPHKAKFLFLDQSVDKTTGELTVRAEVANPDGDLLPGLYMRVALPQATYPNAVLIPQKAVTRGKIDTVLVVEPDGSFHPQPVQIAAAEGHNWIVTGGLKEGAQVIVEGTSHLRGATKVQTREYGSAVQAPAAPAQKPQADGEDKTEDGGK